MRRLRPVSEAHTEAELFPPLLRELFRAKNRRENPCKKTQRGVWASSTFAGRGKRSLAVHLFPLIQLTDCEFCKCS